MPQNRHVLICSDIFYMRYTIPLKRQLISLKCTLFVLQPNTKSKHPATVKKNHLQQQQVVRVWDYIKTHNTKRQAKSTEINRGNLHKMLKTTYWPRALKKSYAYYLYTKQVIELPFPLRFKVWVMSCQHNARQAPQCLQPIIAQQKGTILLSLDGLNGNNALKRSKDLYICLHKRLIAHLKNVRFNQTNLSLEFASCHKTF